MQPTPEAESDPPRRGLWKRLKDRFANHAAQRGEEAAYYPGMHHPPIPPQNAPYPPILSPPLHRARYYPATAPPPIPNAPSVAPISPHGALVARMPLDRNEQRRLAVSLLDELDAYERVQRRVMFFRLLPPLRFHVTVVRNVNGVPQRTETVMNAEQLRNQLLRILHTDNTAFGSDQPHMMFENLGNIRVREGVRDVRVYPTHVYEGGTLPEDKNTCPICLSIYAEGDEIRTIPCLHFYHKECIDEWLTQSKDCPVCKMRIES